MDDSFRANVTGTAPRSRARLAQVPPWTRALVRLLDRAFTIPGTKIPVGLDPILGLIAPGAGDAATALVSAVLLYQAAQLGVPRVVLLRMLFNVGVDALIGAIPFAGDVFDVGFRSAERNLALLQKHGGVHGRPPGVGDYAVLALCLLCVLALLALPILTGLLLIHLVGRLAG